MLCYSRLCNNHQLFCYSRFCTLFLKHGYALGPETIVIQGDIKYILSESTALIIATQDGSVDGKMHSFNSITGSGLHENKVSLLKPLGTTRSTLSNSSKLLYIIREEKYN